MLRQLPLILAWSLVILIACSAGLFVHSTSKSRVKCRTWDCKTSRCSACRVSWRRSRGTRRGGEFGEHGQHVEGGAAERHLHRIEALVRRGDAVEVGGCGLDEQTPILGKGGLSRIHPPLHGKTLDGRGHHPPQDHPVVVPAERPTH
jgi:hypothetical protein